MSKEQPGSWTQKHEIVFLGVLGRHASQVPSSPARTIRLLRGYIVGLANRTVWFKGADPEELRAIAEDRVRRIQQFSLH